MYTAPSVSDPAVGPHLFLCLGCDTALDERTCACGWSTCDCDGCRQSLRLERYDRWRFDHQSKRGMLAIGCAGRSRPPEEVEAPVEEPVAIEQPVVEAPSAEPAPPAEPPVPPAKTASTASFRSMIRLCGLSHAEAAVELGQSESAIKKKSSGSLQSTEADMLHLVVVWQRIRNGDMDKLQPGSRDAAAALRELEE